MKLELSLIPLLSLGLVLAGCAPNQGRSSPIDAKSVSPTDSKCRISEDVIAITLPAAMTTNATFTALSYNIASKRVGNTIYFSVMDDSSDLNIDWMSYRENYNDSRYIFSPLYDGRAKFCKLNLETFQSELIEKYSWDVAAPRVELTVGPSAARPTSLGWFDEIRAFPKESQPNVPPPALMFQPGGPQLIKSSIGGCMLKYIHSPTEVVAFVGTKSRPFDKNEDVWVEFQVRANSEFRVLGLHRLVGTAGVVERDWQWGNMFGFVGNGRHFVYLFEDRLWLVPVPENPYLPKPGAKPEPPAPAQPTVLPPSQPAASPVPATQPSPATPPAQGSSGSAGR